VIDGSNPRDGLLERPPTFPRSLPPNISEEAFNRSYREDMIGISGFVIVIAGTSRTQPISKGVLEECAIAQEMNKVIIPIGATGFAAHSIWVRVAANCTWPIADAAERQLLLEQLNDRNLSNDKLLHTVFEIMRKVSEGSVTARDVNP